VSSSGTDFYRAESAPITDPNDIWNQNLSSTTITPPTIHTVKT
ncbi:unnamed protein product, partial [Rotaria sp. Silwood1]